MKSKLTIEDARELARKAHAMSKAAYNHESGEYGRLKGHFMWALFKLAGVATLEGLYKEMEAARKASE